MQKETPEIRCVSFVSRCCRCRLSTGGTPPSRRPFESRFSNIFPNAVSESSITEVLKRLSDSLGRVHFCRPVLSFKLGTWRVSKLLLHSDLPTMTNCESWVKNWFELDKTGATYTSFVNYGASSSPCSYDLHSYYASIEPISPPNINNRIYSVFFQLRREKPTIWQSKAVERPSFLGREGVFQSKPARSADYSRSAGKRPGSLQVQGGLSQLANQKSQGQLHRHR